MQHFFAVGVLYLVAALRAGPSVAWDYKEHGANWPGACLEDTQSPISLPLRPNTANSTSKLWYRYPVRYEEPLVLFNDGFMLTSTFHAKVGGFGVGPSFHNMKHKYVLQQMSIHAPSEHMWGGTHLPAEVQLVHYSETRGLGVFVIGFSRGRVHTADPFWDVLFRNGIPKRTGEEVKVNTHYPDFLDFETLLGGEVYTYNGSITEPPCRNAQYFVRSEPIEASPEKLDALWDVIIKSTGVSDGNYRVPQPLGGRVVELMPVINGNEIETMKEMAARAPLRNIQPTNPPLVSIPEEERDPDNEDAMRVSDQVKGMYYYKDPTQDVLDEEAKKSSYGEQLIVAYNESYLMNQPQAIIAAMPPVIDAKQAFSDAEVELSSAQTKLADAQQLQTIAEQARDYSQGFDNLTVAEEAVMQAQQDTTNARRVVDAAETKVKAMQGNVVDAEAAGHGEVFWAQHILQLRNEKGGGDGGAVPIPGRVPPPRGGTADPFVDNAAETSPRITASPLPRSMTKNRRPFLRHNAHVVQVT